MAANNGFYNLLFPNILEQSTQISANVVEISIVLAIFTLSNGNCLPVYEHSWLAKTRQMDYGWACL